MERINIGGEERPFNFSFIAIKAYCAEANITLTEFLSNIKEVASIDNIDMLLYAGLAGGAKGEQSFTRKDVIRWIDELGLNGLNIILPKITGAFIASVISDEPKKETAPGPTS